MSGRAYSYKTTPTGQECLLSKTEQVIEVEPHQTAVTVDLKCYFCQEFNQYVEEEKTRRHEATQQVQKFASFWTKVLEEESEKKISGVYEKLQERLETIQSDLNSAQKDESQLLNVVSFPPSYLVNIFYSFVISELYLERVPGGAQGGNGHCRGRRQELRMVVRMVRIVRIGITSQLHTSQYCYLTTL